MALHLSQAETLETLGLAKLGGAATVNRYSAMDLSATAHRKWYNSLAGDDAPEVEDRYIGTVMTYLVYDAAMGKPLDVAKAIERTMKMAAAMPGSFTVSASQARSNERAKLAEARAAELAKYVGKDKGDGDGGTTAPVDADAPVTRKRGRTASGQKSVYTQVQELWVAAVDRTREGFIQHVRDALGLEFGTAQTYYYKAKKETVLVAA